MLKSANYKEGILRQSKFAPKYKVSASKTQGQIQNKKKLKMPNEKGKKQNTNKRRIDKGRV
mgnify:CR=1 FL=1